MAPNITVTNSDANITIVQFNPHKCPCHNLFGHLDGSRPTPARTVSQNNQDVENPAFISWYRQDQLIQNVILASVDPTLAATVVAASTSQASWDALHTAYANKSQTRIFSVRDRLARLAKETLPVADYLHQVRSLCDELATAGAPVSNEELIVKILTGLGPEFREISATIRAKDSTISYTELYEKLLDHELFVKHEESKKPLSTPITATIAQQTNMHPRQGNTGVQMQIPPTPTSQGVPSHGVLATITNSSATHHMASNAQNFTDVHTYHGPEEIAMGDGNTIPISHTGSEYGGASVSWAESRWAI
ncbi:hypothetical protein KY285_031594 [Solanum tuberosum]|nr:hypothetical protein KY284_031389 [Solanum tuberosum]KAH0654628.1 hypothetical protein KY289_032306 [Solanum tuberosum]KAH0656712.1 hypothetical protein KY285_031594 [Solanum tuberosum]